MDAPLVARLSFAALCLLPAIASADFTLRRTIQSPNAANGDGFGTQVVPVGQRADLLVTAPGEGGSPPEAGGAYLLDVTTGELRQHLVSPVPLAESGFGFTAAAFGGFEGTLAAEVLIGAPSDEGAAGASAGVVRRFDAETGTLLDALEGASAGATLGAALIATTPWSAPSDLVITAPGDGVAYRIDGTTSLVTATYPDPTGVAGFGTAVANDGSRLALASPEDGAGAVHLFNAATGALVDSVLNPVPSATGFGRALAFGAYSGLHLYVGAPEASGGGAVYVFDSTGTLIATLTNPDPSASSGFGATLVPIGTQLVVAAPTSGLEAGRAYLLEPATGIVTDTFINPAPDVIGFGASVATLGDTSIVIGAPGSAGEPGAIHVFSICGDGIGAAGEACDDGNVTGGDCCSATCSLEATGSVCGNASCDGPFTLRRVLTNPTSTAGDAFGWRVGEVAGDVFATSFLDPTGAPGAGAAYRFDATTGLLTQSYVNPTPDVTDGLGFGWTTIGSRIFIGAPIDTDSEVSNAGRVYVFDAISGTVVDTWSRPGGPAAVGFGWALAANDAAVAVGAAYENAEAYLFEPFTGTIVATFIDPDGGTGGFGSAIAMRDDVVFVGAPQNELGKVVSFDAATGVVLQTFTPPDLDVYQFGYAIAVHGEALLVGAPGGGGAGVVYVFDSDTGILLQTLSNPNPCETRAFGSSIASVADGVLIGAAESAPGGVTGAAYLYDDATWAVAQSFAPEGPGLFGFGVGAIGGSLLIGAVGDEHTTGEAYVYSVCRNGVVDPGEECDDGDDTGGDGCSAACEAEFGATTTTTSLTSTTTSTTTLPTVPEVLALIHPDEQTVEVGQPIRLNGTLSFANEGGPLDFLWTLVSAPPGSVAAIHDATSAVATLSPDMEGRFEVQLVVSAGATTSEPALAVVTAVHESAISLSIDEPEQGQSTSSRYVRVMGTILAPANTGVTVNGTVASVSGGVFVAESVPLGQGPNVLTATAITPELTTRSASISITNEGGADVLQLESSPTAGVSPLATRFSFILDSELPITGIHMDFDGDGVDDLINSESHPSLAYTFADPGIYVPRLRVEAANGAVFEATTTVVVRSLAETDEIFQGIWSDVHTCLLGEDVDGALRLVTAGSRARFGAIWRALLPHFEEIVPSYSELQPFKIHPNVAHYFVTRTIDDEVRIFFVTFARDGDGVWRIHAM